MQSEQEVVNDDNTQPKKLAIENATRQYYDVERIILESQIVPEYMKDILAIDDIMKDPDEPPESTQQKKIGELLKAGEISEAVGKALDILSAALFGSKKKIGLDHFKKYTDTEKIKDMADDQIQDSIDRLQNKVKSSTLSVSQKLRFTYALSRLLDEKEMRENPNLSPMQKLAANIKKGDVLLVNKNKPNGMMSSVTTKAIQSVQGDIWTHSMIVEDIHPDGTIDMIHSTPDKIEGGRDGVGSISLQQYIAQYQGGDILALQPDEKYRSSLIKHVKRRKKEELRYGKDDGIRALFSRSNVDTNPDTVNCVTLIADSLADAKIEHGNHEGSTKVQKDIHLPKDFIGSHFFTPKYMTTIVTS